jgi:hypothetical protein
MGGSEYEVVFRGRLGPRLVTALELFEVVEATSEQTRLRGWVEDQPALQSALATASDLGMELLSVQRVSRGADRPSR